MHYFVSKSNKSLYRLIIFCCYINSYVHFNTIMLYIICNDWLVLYYSIIKTMKKENILLLNFNNFIYKNNDYKLHI